MSRKNIYFFSVLLSILLLPLFLISKKQGKLRQIYSVVATMQTEPVRTMGDKADDPCIYVHPTQPEQSLIIGTDKDKKKGGLRVYNMDGKQVHFASDGKMNNVDLRYEFPLKGKEIVLVTAGNRSNNSLAVYKLNEETQKLENLAARDITLGIKVYGSCMYKSPKTGKFYAFVNDKKGNIEHWELFETKGKIDAKKVRQFSVPSQAEGCVVDDDLGHLYVGEERMGIWKFYAEPDGNKTGKLIDSIGKNLTADVEGLTIYYADDKTGYLIASSQGDNTYAVYERQGDNKYLGSFKIVEGDGIDGTSDTDGIDVTSVSLGENFPHGMFVVQDGNNKYGKQNFKCVPWESIANQFSPPLKIAN